ncbi:hypothetical protein LCGC14_1285420 [marine sediment metagenome]|uniref:Uncharacterized protein n=1 Tax=marine sediment metagenome TaxID=412755 RepID=A0A0F9KU26_9ZZZZ
MKKQVMISCALNKHCVISIEESHVKGLISAFTANKDRLVHLNDYSPLDDPIPDEIYIKASTVEMIIVKPMSNIAIPDQRIQIPIGAAPVA